jgi:hypothetical protein
MHAACRIKYLKVLKNAKELKVKNIQSSASLLSDENTASDG